MTSTSPHSSDRRARVDVAAAAAVAACAVAGIGLKLAEVDDAAGNLAGGALMALAAVLLGWRAVRASGRTRTVWALFVAVAGLNAVAETTWSVRDIMGVDQGAVSLPVDALFLASYPCALAGMWLMITAANRRGALATLPEAGAFLIVVGFAAWQLFVAYPESSATATADRVVLSAYPLLDAALAAMAVWFVLSRRSGSWPALCIAGFALAYMAGDVLYALADVVDGVEYRYPDAVFCGAFGLLALAAVSREPLVHPGPPDATRAQWRAAVARALIIAGTLAIGPLTALLSWRAGVDTPAAVVAGVLGVAALVVTARLVLLVHELEVAEASAREAEARVAHQAAHDDLTGLPNRRLLVDRLRVAAAQTRRRGTRLGVLYLDLDGFKAVNDTHGHAAGDELLRQVSVRLQEAVRRGDTVARIGGDEFVVALPDVADAREAGTVAEHVVEALAAPFVVEGVAVTSGASVGVALVENGDGDGMAAVRRADDALGQAKRAGRGRTRTAPEGRASSASGAADT